MNAPLDALTPKSLAAMAKQQKEVEDLRKWAVEQSIKLLPDKNHVIEVARMMENFVKGRGI